MGLPSVIPQTGVRVSDSRRGSCSVEHGLQTQRQSPGATIFGPPEKPAKKCGSTKPVVIRTSASSHSGGSARPARQRPTSQPKQVKTGSRASWFTTRDSCRRPRSPSIVAHLDVGIAAVGSGGDEDDDIVKVDDILQFLGSMAGSTTRRGCGRVPSQTLMATVCPRRTTLRSGGPATPVLASRGRRPSDRASAAGARCVGTITSSAHAVGPRPTRPLRKPGGPSLKSCHLWATIAARAESPSDPKDYLCEHGSAFPRGRDRGCIGELLERRDPAIPHAEEVHRACTERLARLVGRPRVRSDAKHRRPGVKHLVDVEGELRPFDADSPEDVVPPASGPTYTPAWPKLSISVHVQSSAISASPPGRSPRPTRS